jgi:hypothetical protein
MPCNARLPRHLGIAGLTDLAAARLTHKNRLNEASSAEHHLQKEPKQKPLVESL